MFFRLALSYGKDFLGYLFFVTELLRSVHGPNSDKFPIHKDLVLPCVYDHRMLYEHHIRSDADIVHNRKWF